ncbi:MAG: tetratricopeptide repeat protein [Bacteroidia bacterium]
MASGKLTKREKFAAAQAQAKTQPSKSVSSAPFPAWWAFLPALLGFLVYMNTLGHSFALDDYAAILENTSTKRGIAAIGEIFRTSYRYGYLFIADDLYRPLPKAIYAVFWDLWPDNATPGHWLNVLLFAFTCYFIFRFLAYWLPGNKGVALIAACIFAVHPIHTEVVANIKSLDEIIGFLLGIVSLHLFLLHLQNGKFLLLTGAIISLFFALLSKESSVTFLALYPLFAWCFTDADKSKWIRSAAIMLVPVILFLFIRHSILFSNPLFKPGAVSVSDNMLVAAKQPLDRLAGAVAMLGYYGYKLLVPTGLSFDMSYPQMKPEPVSSPVFIISAILYLSMLVWSVSLIRKKDLLGLSILAFFVLVSVSSNIFVMIGTHYGERLLYAPSFAFALFVAVALLRFIGKADQEMARIPVPVMAVAGGIVLVFSGLSMARNPVWKDNGTLYKSGLTSAPNSARVHYYEGLWLNKPESIASFPESSRDSATAAGVMHLRKAVELYPPFSDAWTQLGVSYYRQQKLQDALAAYTQALKYNNIDPVTLNNLGSVYFSMNNFNEALRLYLEAIRYKSDYPDALMNIGSCYGALQKYDLAIRYFEKAIAVDPQFKQAYYFLGITYRNLGNEALANQYLSKAETLKAH